MEQKDLVKIPQSVIDELKKNIQKYILKDKKPFGFDEAVRYIALEKATTSQLAKLNSFANHHTTTNHEDNDKKEVLDKMIVFAKNWVAIDKRKKELSNNIRTDTEHPTGASTKNQSGREVDRFQKTDSNVKPYTTKQIQSSGLVNECNRIIEIMKIIQKKQL